MNEVNTQDMFSRPPRSEAIRGSAVVTTVWFKAPTVIPMTTAEKIATGPRVGLTSARLFRPISLVGMRLQVVGQKPPPTGSLYHLHVPVATGINGSARMETHPQEGAGLS